MLSTQLTSSPDSRLREIACLVVEGKKVPEIADKLGLTVKWTRQLIRDAKLKGLEGTLYPDQNEATREMEELRRVAAKDAWGILGKRLKQIVEEADKSDGKIDSSAITDALRILDRTEHIGSPKMALVAPRQVNNLTIFEAHQIKKAEEASNRVGVGKVVDIAVNE